MPDYDIKPQFSGFLPTGNQGQKILPLFIIGVLGLATPLTAVLPDPDWV